MQIKIVSFQNELKERLDELQDLQKKLERALSQDIGGNIQISTNHNNPQFYKIEDGVKSYLSKTKLEDAQKILQLKYYRKTLFACKNEIRRLEPLINLYQNESNAYTKIDTVRVYEKLSPVRQSLVTAVCPTTEQFVNQWKQTEHQHKTAKDDEVPYLTANKEKVRSKSELIIANLLYQNNIPYRYEPLLKLPQGEFYPDFLCLNVRTRQEIYWEHFGLLTDSDYATKTVRKLSIYQTNNLHLGRNLIISTEAPKYPLNTTLIQNLIDTYLK